MDPGLYLIYQLNQDQMNPDNCKCSKCNGSLHYQISTNVALQIIGLKVYWCHKCDSNTYIWPWTVNTNELLDRHKKI